MVSLNFLCLWCQKAGMINFHRFPTVWQDRLQSVYVFIHITVYLIFALGHTYNTVTRAIRYRPEFVQRFLEDWIMMYLLYAVLIIRMEYRRINYMNDCLEYFLSHAYPEVSQQCARQCRMVLASIFALVFSALVGSYGETLLPVSESELRIRHEVYRTKHPERSLPFSLRVPFVDETESYMYEILYACVAYVTVFFLFWASLSVIFSTIIAIQIRGQYQILARHVAGIGRPHWDALGNRVYYTSLAENRYVVVKMYSRVSKRLRSEDEREYQRQFLRQIIQYHTRLLALKTELNAFLSPLVYGLVVANNIMISLCFYQMVVSPVKISPLRHIKFISELIAVTGEYYILCQASEISDDCHELMRRALVNSRWYSCSSDMRRDLCILIRRVQKDNHFRFLGGAVVVSRIFFLKVVRTAYSFFNFIRLSIHN